jgi:hypothetical protein
VKYSVRFAIYRVLLCLNKSKMFPSVILYTGSNCRVPDFLQHLLDGDDGIVGNVLEGIMRLKQSTT